MGSPGPLRYFAETVDGQFRSIDDDHLPVHLFRASIASYLWRVSTSTHAYKLLLIMSVKPQTHHSIRCIIVSYGGSLIVHQEYDHQNPI